MAVQRNPDHAQWISDRYPQHPNTCRESNLCHIERAGSRDWRLDVSAEPLGGWVFQSGGIRRPSADSKYKRDLDYTVWQFGSPGGARSGITKFGLFIVQEFSPQGAPERAVPRRSFQPEQHADLHSSERQRSGVDNWQSGIR